MIMYLNNNQEKPITIYGYSRSLDFGKNILYRISLQFGEDYPYDAVDNLANFAHKEITDLEIVDGENARLAMHDAKIRLESLQEDCTVDGRHAYASLAAYSQDEIAESTAMDEAVETATDVQVAE